MRAGRQRVERLDAPRTWLPRTGWRGLLRAGCVCLLLLTAAAILALNPDRDTPTEQRPGSGAPGPRSGAPGPGPGTPGPASGPGEQRAASGEQRAGHTSRAAPAARDCTTPTGGPPPGTVGFPLRLADPAVLAVVRAGERVDILVRQDPSDPSSQPRSNAATVVASDLPVLRTVGSGGEPDGVLYLAVSRQQAATLAAIGPTVRVSVTVRSPD